MQVVEDFRPLTDRYEFDFGECSCSNGFAQFDTRQDASYFGTWVNPTTRQVVSYTEGDVAHRTAETDAEFVEYVRELADWNKEAGYWLGIDPGIGEKGDRLRAAFDGLGLADLLH